MATNIWAASYQCFPSSVYIDGVGIASMFFPHFSLSRWILNCAHVFHSVYQVVHQVAHNIYIYIYIEERYNIILHVIYIDRYIIYINIYYR